METAGSYHSWDVHGDGEGCYGGSLEGVLGMFFVFFKGEWAMVEVWGVFLVRGGSGATIYGDGGFGEQREGCFHLQEALGWVVGKKVKKL